jgi:hypothetical protein
VNRDERQAAEVKG